MNILDKFGYIGIELTVVGLLILGMHAIMPKDWPIDVKVGAGLVASGLASFVLYMGS